MNGSVSDIIVSAWDSLSNGAAGSKEWRALRIDAAHCLDVFAAIREEDQAHAILFECPVSVQPAWRLRFISEGIRMIDERDDSEAVRRVVLVLERADLESVFLVLAADLIAATKDAGSVELAFSALGERLSAWQACLQTRKSGFGDERVRGLFGELVFLQRLAELAGFSYALSKWQGPMRALHDFVWPRSAVEVKTSLGVATAVQIGSLHQLDEGQLERIVLCRVVLVRDDDGMCLSQLVSNARTAADNVGPVSRRELDVRLLMSGYVDVNADTREETFSVAAVEFYVVAGDFPRLTAQTVPAGVVAAEYRVDLRFADKQRVDDGHVVPLLTELLNEG